MSVFRRFFIGLWLAGAVCATGTDAPKREIRAVWLATVYGLDWPSQPATDEAGRIRQQEELCVLLDRLQAANFNTVFIQTRLRGDVIYQSDTEPAAKVFSGKYGVMPGYDPLAFAIDECHRRGLECHAFLVTYPVGSPRVVEEQGALSVVKRHPELCLRHGNNWYLDPGQPGTCDYILSIVREIVSRYDVDGIQFDYVRYPEQAQSFPDQQTFAAYGNGENLADWRRGNINRLMEQVYDWVRQTKPWVQVSSSPLGKYRRDMQTPNAVWTAFDDVYQDPKAWLQAGKQDMIVPMMYYRANDFYPFVNIWVEQVAQRNMVAGLGAYRLNRKEGDWNLSEMVDQINYVRRQGGDGCAFFRARFVVGDEKGLYGELKNHLFRFPAQLPPLTWLSDTLPPPAPQEMIVTRRDDCLQLSWEDASPPGENTYTVYYSLADTLDTNQARSILATGVRDREIYLPVDIAQEKGYLFCVTASNRYRMESRPSYETYYYLSAFE
ncbi:MAG: family 10 glycosylhydrolase, partial [Tannerella sp.]|nr:family 10 glycosylhydrolase [Tannerella sp.]